MSRAIAVLRPEPGNAATARRVEQAGRTALRLPLFASRALDWTPPDPAAFDALILTSANAARLAGDSLKTLTGLPVYAVGEASAAAARAAGLSVAYVGTGDAAALTAHAERDGIRRALFLCGREHRLQPGGIVAQAIPVYAADPLPVDIAALTDTVALLHSARAATCLATLAGPARAAIAIAAISPAVAEAAGPGWASVAIAPAPSDDALIASAIALRDCLAMR